MNLQSTSCFLLLSTTLIGVAAAQDGARKITISPKAGTVGHFRVTEARKQIMELMGQESNNEIVTDLQVAVDEVAADGTVKATATWLRIHGTMNAPMGGEIEFDTKKPDEASDDPMFGSLVESCLALIGHKTALTFGADGKLKDKKPLKELNDKMADKLSGQAKMMLQSSFNPSVLENQVGVFGTFPTEAVATGGSWTDTKEQGARGGLSMATEFKHTLATATADAYEISTTGTIGLAPAKKGEDDEDDEDEGAAMMRSMMRDAKIKDGKVEAQTKISRKDGLVESSLATTSMAIHMNNPMGGDEPFVVGIKQTTKVERVQPEAETKAKEAKGTPASPKK